MNKLLNWLWPWRLDSITVRSRKILPPKPMQDLLARVERKERIAKVKPQPKLVREKRKAMK